MDNVTNYDSKYTGDLKEYRKNTGSYFTPIKWADKCHEYIAKTYGNGWKDEYIVWDCCCGTGNLTNTKSFTNLYQSSLSQEELNALNDSGRGNGNTVFQFDFLNDGLSFDTTTKHGVKHFNLYRDLQVYCNESGEDIPSLTKASFNIKENLESVQELKEMLDLIASSGKELLFFINPPFSESTASLQGIICEKYRANTALCTKTQITPVFLYRILDIAQSYNIKLNLAVITLSSAITSLSSVPLTLRLQDIAGFVDGFIFPLKEFDDVVSIAGCTFSMFKSGYTSKDELRYDALLTNNNVISSIGIKCLNLAYKDTDVRLFADIAKFKEKLAVCSSHSNIDIGQSGTICNDFIGTVRYHCNRPENNQYCFSSTIPVNRAQLPFSPVNMHKALTLAALRVLVDDSWHTRADTFSIPTMSDELTIYMYNCSVYSLFNEKAFFVAMKDDIVRVRNHLFYMTREEVRILANTYNYEGLLSEIDTDSQLNPNKSSKSSYSGYESYMCEELERIKPYLYPEILNLLEAAKALTIKSFKYRKDANKKTSGEYHLDLWDAGWLQIRKGLLEEHCIDDYKEFKLKLDTVKQLLLTGVYKHGFLKSQLIIPDKLKTVKLDRYKQHKLELDDIDI